MSKKTEKFEKIYVRFAKDSKLAFVHDYNQVSEYNTAYIRNDKDCSIVTEVCKTPIVDTQIRIGNLVVVTKEVYDAWLNRNAPKPEEPKAKKEKAADKTATAVEENKEGA